MLALVTGPTGFLGSHLVERLRLAGHRVRALIFDRPDPGVLRHRDIERVAGDITRPESLVRAVEGVDAVFHTAALVTHWGPWSDYEAITVRGTENMLAAAVQARVRRFVHI